MRINYSCVVDKHERFKKQGWLWLNSLIKLGKINPANIWVHCISGMDGEYIDKCAAVGVNVAVIEPYGDGTYCNKIAQMSNEKLKDADAVILMDTDMIMLQNFENTLDSNYISAKIVDMPNPSIDVIDSLFQLSGLKKTLPDMSVECADDITYSANFNGGLYFIPKEYCGAVQSGWEKWAKWLLANGKPIYDAKREAHIDQVSFCMNVHERKIPVKHLSRLYNYPLPYQLGDSDIMPYVLHYHTQINENHLLTVDYNPVGNIKKAVDLANEFIAHNISLL